MEKIEKSITVEKLGDMSKKMFDSLVKAVVDVEKEVMVVDAEMHADQEQFLLDEGSKQENLWGINLYPERYGKNDFLEYDSMINIRPAQNNRSRGVEDEELRKKIRDIVERLIIE